jgi:hypothetical protein
MQMENIFMNSAYSANFMQVCAHKTLNEFVGGVHDVKKVNFFDLIHLKIYINILFLKTSNKILY